MLKKFFKKLYALIWILTGLALSISLFSYHVSDPSFNTASDLPIRNYLGSFGAYTSDLFLQAIGFSAYVVALFAIMHGIFILFQKKSSFVWLKRLTGFLGLVLFCVLLAQTDKGGFVGSLIYRQVPVLHWTLKGLLWFIAFASFIFCLDIPVVSWTKWGCSYIKWAIQKYLFKKQKEVEAPVLERPKKETVLPDAKKSVKKAKTLPVPVLKNHNGFELPSVDLLDEPKAQTKETMTRDMMENTSRHLESVLAQYGVKGEIVRVSPGPVVTLYELALAPGIKTSRVIGLTDDIAREMSVTAVRVAVIPGTSFIGIEIPNKIRQTVYIKEVLDTKEFFENTGTLPLILGKNIGGTPVFADLAKMPHLLVAGTTGSGKSVGINTMILSLLYRFTPQECRMIMVDPKMLELSVYNGIPHLLTPVVTEPGKAVVALKWVVKEMDDRYRLMAEIGGGVRKIESYNEKIREAIQKGEKLTRQVQTGFDPETGRPVIETQEIPLTPMPYIVVVVDEMADLMLSAGKDVEIAIQRIAQKARASGIHLIMATQRPSVDVITGTIKANFPSRISFQVTNMNDSRTILGESGAEWLLGRGDMLFMPAGVKPTRVHGPFVSDNEVERVVSYLKTQGEADYNEAVTIDEDEEDTIDEGSVFDRSAMGRSGGGDLYEQAVQIVLTDKRPTISYIQRKLGIGYNRAADLIDRMEHEGIVSKASPTGRREILNGGGNK